MDSDEETPDIQYLNATGSSSHLNGQSLASAQLLYETRRIKFSPPDNLKSDSGKGETSDGTNLNRVLDHTHYLTSLPKSKLKSSLGQAIWLPDKNLALVTQRRGTLGFHRDGNYYLHPEEAAFAIDNCEYEITLDSLPISLEEAYTIFFRSQREQDIFRVYSILRKHGFRVGRFQKHPSNVNEEKRSHSGSSTPINGDTTSDGIDSDCITTCASSKREPPSGENGPLDSNGIGHRKKVKINDEECPMDDCEMIDTSDDSSLKPLTAEMIYGEDKYLSHPVNLLLKHKSQDWRQFKNPANIFDKDSKFTGSVVHFSQIPSLCSSNVKDLLPPSALKTNSIQPIVKFDRIMTINQLLARLQSSGPSVYSEAHTNSVAGELADESRSKAINEILPDDLQLIFTVAASPKHPFHVAILSYRDDFPNFMQLEKLFKVTERGSLLMAVVDESTVHFYKLTPFDMWQEVPLKWLTRSLN